MFPSKAKIALALLLAAGLLATGAGVLARQALADKGPEPKSGAAPKAAPAKDSETVKGQVFGIDGKPLAGAELSLVGRKEKVEKLGVTDADGRFTVRAPRGKRWVNLLARAPGVGADFVDLGTAPAGDVVLRLVKDHPIRGRVLDTEGKPVAGVTVAVEDVSDYGARIDPFLAAWKARDPHSGIPGGGKHVWDEGAFPTTTTGKDGRFTVEGVGAERLVRLRLRGGGVAESQAWVVNRPGFDPNPYNRATADRIAQMRFPLARQWLLTSPEPAIVAEAEKPIRGVVKDRDTGKPRANVKVTLSRNGNELAAIQVSATTDAQGRYEIRGARKSAKGYMVELRDDPKTGYMACQARAADTPGYGPITLDVPAKKGVVITGRVRDGSTGKALPCVVYASVLVDNPFVKDFPEFDGAASFHSATTADDGSFRIVTLPGPVILMGGIDTRRVPEGMMAWIRYIPPVPDPNYPKYFSKRKGLEGDFFTAGGGISPIQGNFCKVLVLDPKAAVVQQDVVLEPASALPVRIQDANGRPVAGCWATGLGPQYWHRPVRVTGNSTAVYHLQPDKPRLLVVHDPDGKRFGTLRLKGDEKEPQVVTVGPGASVKGRLVGDDGAPIAGASVRLYHRDRTAEEMHAHVHQAKPIETDANGRFTIDAVVPGQEFSLSFSRGRRTFRVDGKLSTNTTSAGKATDLGDVKVRSEPENQGE